jgi:hypothetical protein
MLSKQNQVNKLHVNRTAGKPTTGCALWDTLIRRGGRKKTQCFRVRAGVFARAHGRPDGMPGRSIGARAKALPLEKQIVVWSDGGGAAEESKLEISDFRAKEIGKRISMSYRRGYEQQG